MTTKEPPIARAFGDRLAEARAATAALAVSLPPEKLNLLAAFIMNLTKATTIQNRRMYGITSSGRVSLAPEKYRGLPAHRDAYLPRQIS
jgi:hypothetical protein